MLDWYPIVNYTEFLATNLVQRELDVILEGRGQYRILVSRGNLLTIYANGEVLPVQMLGKNPFSSGSMSVYRDEHDLVWLGFAAS